MARISMSVVAILAAFPGLGCQGSSGPTPDPPGTVTTDLRNSPDLGANGINFETGATGSVGRIGDTFGLEADLSLAQGNWNGALIDFGEVSGVGDVEMLDGIPFLDSMSAIVGHGYLAQTREGNVYGVYVKEDIVGTSGGIIGERITWIPLRVLQSVQLTPTGGNLAVAETLQFTLTAEFSDGSSMDAASFATVAWGASDQLVSGPCVASVNANGLVTANMMGSATITAAIQNTQVTAPVGHGCSTTATGDFAATATVAVE